MYSVTAAEKIVNYMKDGLEVVMDNAAIRGWVQVSSSPTDQSWSSFRTYLERTHH